MANSVISTDRRKQPSNLQQCGRGNPIYPLTGAKRQPVETNLRLGFQNLNLTYDSSRAPWTSNGVASLPGEVVVPGDLGSLWWNSLHRQLYLSANGLTLKASRGDDTALDFTLQGGQWVAGLDARTTASDQRDTLKAISGGFVYRDQAGLTLETYDSSGKMVSWTSASGMKLNASYTSGNLSQLSDPFGRSIGFAYTTQGLSSITDPIGQSITPGYDSTTGNLTSLTWQDSAVKGFVYDSPNANQSWALTGVIDESAKRYATFGYDATGHAISTEHAGGVDKYSVTYPNSGVGPKVLITEVYDTSGSTPVVRRYHDWTLDQPPVVTWPTGAVETFKAPDLTLNYPRDMGRQQPAGAGCGASSNALTYDSNGNKASEDDFNGHRTCYANDLTRNLETGRIEGLLGGTSGNSCPSALSASSFTGMPAETRKFSTQWHPDWAIKTKQAEPYLLTYWIYNGQPDPTNSNQILTCTSAKYGATSVAPLLDDGSGTVKPIAVLCKKVEQATTDSNGLQGLTPTLDTSAPNVTAQRQWTYQYNQYGQVLTSTGPEGTVTNTYYCQDSATCDGTNKYVFAGTAPNESGHYQGDLYTVTNAANHTTTTYNSYDRAGRVLSMSDLNGLTTTYTYWPRGWVKTVTQGGGLITKYDYWPTGLLKLVTQPDGSALSYVYDDAHRLTDVTDNLGNTVHYTLDNAGNRLSEALKDSGGNLSRNITRTYDVLNRLWTTKGLLQ